jgi:GNAT superfamily N-acetyltransferase
MQPWTVEYGTLWAWERENGRPPLAPVQVEFAFEEIDTAGIDDRNDLDELAAAMHLPTPEVIRQRLASNRRCFVLKVNDQIITYGWVTHGVEAVGELERQFHLHEDEAYVWDCGTVPAWRRQGCYSALLSHMIDRLYEEGVSRIWIGASRLNRPSVRGIANAGFQHVVDVNYRRFYRLTILRIQASPTALPAHISAAYRILINDHEQVFGRLAIGYKR